MRPRTRRLPHPRHRHAEPVGDLARVEEPLAHGLHPRHKRTYVRGTCLEENSRDPPARSSGEQSRTATSSSPKRSPASSRSCRSTTRSRSSGCTARSATGGTSRRAAVSRAADRGGAPVPYGRGHDRRLARRAHRALDGRHGAWGAVLPGVRLLLGELGRGWIAVIASDPDEMACRQDRRSTARPVLRASSATGPTSPKRTSAPGNRSQAR